MGTVNRWVSDDYPGSYDVCFDKIENGFIYTRSIYGDLVREKIREPWALLTSFSDEVKTGKFIKKQKVLKGDMSGLVYLQVGSEFSAQVLETQSTGLEFEWTFHLKIGEKIRHKSEFGLMEVVVIDEWRQTKDYSDKMRLFYSTDLELVIYYQFEDSQGEKEIAWVAK